MNTDLGPGTVVGTGQGNVVVPGAVPVAPGTPAGQPALVDDPDGGDEPVPATVVETSSGPVAVPDAALEGGSKLFGFPTWMVLGGAAAALYFFTKKKG
jgi:hypothetical protein